jgi:hypothetical protein
MHQLHTCWINPAFLADMASCIGGSFKVVLPESLWSSFGAARLLMSRVFPRRFRLTRTIVPT